MNCHPERSKRFANAERLRSRKPALSEAEGDPSSQDAGGNPVVHSTCFVIFSKTPTQASVTKSDDPPYDTSGNGIPLVGIIPSTTLMLMNACRTTMLVIPTARYRPKVSSVRHETRIPRHKKTANSVTTNKAPTNPNSSAVTAKIKSVCGSGR